MVSEGVEGNQGLHERCLEAAHAHVVSGAVFGLVEGVSSIGQRKINWGEPEPLPRRGFAGSYKG
jgi:hypothetical protein